MAIEITTLTHQATAANDGLGKATPVTLRTLLSRNHLWRHLRDIQAEGLYRTLSRRPVWSGILDTAPIITEPLSDAAGVETHILTYNRDYLSAIWALKSFYHYSGVRYPLVIHAQGRTSHRMLARLRKHFPTANLITQAEADSRVERWLLERRYPNLLTARRSSIMMMKLIDFLITGR